MKMLGDADKHSLRQLLYHNGTNPVINSMIELMEANCTTGMAESTKEEYREAITLLESVVSEALKGEQHNNGVPK